MLITFIIINYGQQKKALLEVTYHIVKIHVNNDVKIVLEFFNFSSSKKRLKKIIQNRCFLQSNTL